MTLAASGIKDKRKRRVIVFYPAKELVYHTTKLVFSMMIEQGVKARSIN